MSDEHEETGRTPAQRQARVVFRLGDGVRIKSGPFASFRGEVGGINQAKAPLKVKVTIFGRQEPVVLRYADVEAIARS